MIELQPVSLSAGSLGSRSVLIFKDQSGQHVLPVWLDPVDAGLMMADSHQKVRSSGVHYAVMKVMGTFGLQVDRVVFDDVIGHHQYMTLHLRQGRGKNRSVKIRAA